MRWAALLVVSLLLVSGGIYFGSAKMLPDALEDCEVALSNAYIPPENWNDFSSPPVPATMHTEKLRLHSQENRLVYRIAKLLHPTNPTSNLLRNVCSRGYRLPSSDIVPLPLAARAMGISASASSGVEHSELSMGSSVAAALHLVVDESGLVTLEELAGKSERSTIWTASFEHSAYEYTGSFDRILSVYLEANGDHAQNITVRQCLQTNYSCKDLSEKISALESTEIFSDIEDSYQSMKSRYYRPSHSVKQLVGVPTFAQKGNDACTFGDRWSYFGCMHETEFSLINATISSEVLGYGAGKRYYHLNTPIPHKWSSGVCNGWPAETRTKDRTTLDYDDLRPMAWAIVECHDQDIGQRVSNYLNGSIATTSNLDAVSTPVITPNRARAQLLEAISSHETAEFLEKLQRQLIANEREFKSFADK